MKLQAMSTSPLYTRTRYFCKENTTHKPRPPEKTSPEKTSPAHLNTTANLCSDMWFDESDFRVKNVKAMNEARCTLVHQSTAVYTCFLLECRFFKITNNKIREKRCVHWPEQRAASCTVSWRPGRDDRSSDSPQNCNTRQVRGFTETLLTNRGTTNKHAAAPEFHQNIKDD